LNASATTAKSTRSSEQPLGLVSIVVSSYNYADFLPIALDSALALDWPAVEVIVVDDGSTDSSRSVIESYGDRVTAVFQSNQGQTSAYNAGFARSRGDAVIFLDADDILHPSLIRRVARVWSPAVSKVQVQMRIIDEQGRAQGALLPQYDVVPSAGDVTRWMTATSDYPTPPGSANIYARAFLEKIIPISGENRAGDSYCIAAAPFLGEVVTVAEPLVSYRVHGRNNGAMSSLDARRFAKEVGRAMGRFHYARAIAARTGVTMPERAVHRGLRFLPYRLASLRLEAATHPVAGDSVSRVLSDAARAVREPQGYSARSRAALLGWLLLTATLPLPLAKRLILWRFVSASRPETLRRALRALGVLRADPEAGPSSTRGVAPCA